VREPPALAAVPAHRRRRRLRLQLQLWRRPLSRPVVQAGQDRGRDGVAHRAPRLREGGEEALVAVVVAVLVAEEQEAAPRPAQAQALQGVQRQQRPPRHPPRALVARQRADQRGGDPEHEEGRLQGLRPPPRVAQVAVADGAERPREIADGEEELVVMRLPLLRVFRIKDVDEERACQHPVHAPALPFGLTMVGWGGWGGHVRKRAR
jgi:hypothetical protein